MFEMNSINLTYFLDGKTEAELYVKGEIRKVEMSNVSKVQGMKKIMALLFENNLKVEFNKINKIYHFIKTNPLIGILIFVITIIGFFIAIYTLILPSL